MKLDEGDCLYVIFNPITNLTKIGISENVQKRKQTLEAACGVPLELIYHTNHLLCASQYETEAHVTFHDQRAIGEWFHITPQQAKKAVEDITRQATREPIIEYYKSGMTISELAKTYNVSRQAILAKLKTYGVYDKDGKIAEKRVRKTYDRRTKSIVTTTESPVPKWDINEIHDTNELLSVKPQDDGIYFLDDRHPSLPIKNMKRSEPNINFNGEWYQVNIYYKGFFTYAYTQDIKKARQFILELENRTKH